jgi:hypothetical protein
MYLLWINDLYDDRRKQKKTSPRGVDAAVAPGFTTASTTYPMPYSKLCEPFGPFGRQAAAPGIGRIDVVYGDVVKLAHDAMRQLVQKGMARMGNAGVAVARLTLFIGPAGPRSV